MAETRDIEITPTDALHFGGEVDHRILAGVLNPERKKLQDSRDWAAELRKLTDQAGEKTFREVLRRSRERYLDQTQIDNLKLIFGGGFAKREEDGSISFSDDVPREAEATHAEAIRSMEIPLAYLKYADVIKRAKVEGRRPEDLGGLDWTSVREKAIDGIIGIDGVRDIFPELSYFGTDRQKRDYIEITLARDPAFAEKVNTSMTSIVEAAKSLPQAQEDPETATAKIKKENAEQRLNQAMMQVLTEIKALGFDGVDDAFMDGLKSSIESRIRTGASTEIESALHMVRDKLQHSDKGVLKVLEIDQLDSRIKRLTDERQKANESKNTDRAQKLTQEINNSESARAKMVDSFGDVENIEAAEQKMKRIDSLTSVNKLPTGEFSSQLAHELLQVSNAKKEMVEADEVIVARESEAGERMKHQVADRLIAERALIDRLESIMPDALSDILDERYAEMLVRENKRLDMIDRENKEELDEKTAAYLKWVDHAIKTKWIENATSRKKIIHKDQIGKDILRATYHGDEGIQRMILRDLNLGIDWQHIDLETGLTDEQKHIFSEAMNRYKQSYQEKLFSSFFEARTRRDEKIMKESGRGGKLSLKEHEWQLLQKNFGSQLESGLNASKEGKAVLDALASRGITKESSRGDWIKYLLAALGGGLILASVALPAALGVGSAVAGSGSLGAAFGLNNRKS